MGLTDKQWEVTKAERRKEYLEALREFQTKEHKAKFVTDAKQVIFMQEQKLKRIDLTEAEVKECTRLIENAQLIINKHK
mgnify:CR=1 FL=1